MIPQKPPRGIRIPPAYLSAVGMFVMFFAWFCTTVSQKWDYQTIFGIILVLQAAFVFMATLLTATGRWPIFAGFLESGAVPFLQFHASWLILILGLSVGAETLFGRPTAGAILILLFIAILASYRTKPPR